MGDIAEVELIGGTKGYIIGLKHRRNSLIRPPVANVDLILLILSVIDPPPNLMIVDRMLAIVEHKGIDAAIVITKSDLANTDELCQLYRSVGYKVISIDSLSESPKEAADLIKGNICVLAGNTGVGKSTLLNAIDPKLALKTGETSRKLGRGRHTTRVTELFALCGGLIADTPGFSSLEMAHLEHIKKEDLELCFREFYVGKCRFTGCSHTKEKGCAVLAAVSSGIIMPSRHKNYCEMYGQARLIKDWEV